MRGTPGLGRAPRWRFHREQAGLTQEELGRAVHVSPSMIGMVETGRRAPRVEFIRACDRVLGTNGALARLWKRITKHSYLEWFRPFVEVESEAMEMLKYEPQAVPGLLQTGLRPCPTAGGAASRHR